MAGKAVKKSPQDGDERRKPGGGKRPARRGEKKGPATTPTNHPYKVPPVPAGQSVAGGRRRGPKPGAADQREALFNGGAVGTFKEVMVRHHEVTLLRGILIEIDGECLRVGNVIEAMPADGFELYERHVSGWLDNHPVLRKAEVRFSGRWLHCILWFDTPVEIQSDRQRELWDEVVEGVQRALPSDPEAPTLLAMTRPVGSINSKTGRKVELIKPGEPVTEQEVFNFVDDLAQRGFATVTQILFGSTTVSPCPFCREEDSTLSGTAPRYRTSDPRIINRGSCYYCGKVALNDLISLVLKGREKEQASTESDTHSTESAATDSVAGDSDHDDCPFSIPAEGQGGN
jgi:hypothetical protein